MLEGVARGWDEVEYMWKAATEGYDSVSLCAQVGQLSARVSAPHMGAELGRARAHSPRSLALGLTGTSTALPCTTSAARAPLDDR